MLNIPKSWDATWFRNLVSTQLKGADVRNAIGANGITVNGNISSPYATIGFGPTVPGNLTFTGDIVIAPASGTPLAVKSNSGIVTFEVTGSITAPTVEGYGPTAGALVDMTPDTGIFTGTLTGCTTSPTGTCIWTKMGNLVTIQIPAVTGTSNTTSMTMTGTPAEIQPTHAQNLPCIFLEDNSGAINGSVQMAANGTITFYNGTSNGGTSFTAAGTKGIRSPASFTYALSP